MSTKDEQAACNHCQHWHAWNWHCCICHKRNPMKDFGKKKPEVKP